MPMHCCIRSISTSLLALVLLKPWLAERPSSPLKRALCLKLLPMGWMASWFPTWSRWPQWSTKFTPSRGKLAAHRSNPGSAAKGWFSNTSRSINRFWENSKKFKVQSLKFKVACRSVKKFQVPGLKFQEACRSGSNFKLEPLQKVFLTSMTPKCGWMIYLTFSIIHLSFWRKIGNKAITFGPPFWKVFRSANPILTLYQVYIKSMSCVLKHSVGIGLV